MRGQEQFPRADASARGWKASKHKQPKPMKTPHSRTNHLWRTLALAVTVLVAALKLNAATYTVIDLGPGAAISINNSNYVVGHDGSGYFKYDPTGYQMGSATLWAPVGSNTWSATNLANRSEFEPTYKSEARKINDSGVIVGIGFITNTSAHTPCIWTPSTNGFSLSFPLSAYTDDYYETHSINNNGVYNLQKGMSDQTAGPRTDSWLSSGSLGSYTGHFTSIGELGSYYSMAYDINDSGIVVGHATGGTSNEDRYDLAFIWAGSELVSLGTLGGSYSEAYGVNASGKTVGYAYTSNGYHHAFLWTPTTTNGTSGSMSDINPSWSDNSYAYGINSSGLVVGGGIFETNQTITAHAFVYSAGSGAQDLNTLIPTNSGWTLYWATSINNAGYIVGYGAFDTYDYSACPPEPVSYSNRAFLLIPDP